MVGAKKGLPTAFSACVDAGVEVGVVADLQGRQMKGAGGAVVQEVGGEPFGGVAAGQQGGDGGAKGAVGAAFPFGKEAEAATGVDVEDAVADGDTAAPGFLFADREHAEGEVLDGEVGVAVGALDPALQGRVVGVVDRVVCARAGVGAAHGAEGLKRRVRPSQQRA